MLPGEMTHNALYGGFANPKKLGKFTRCVLFFFEESSYFSNIVFSQFVKRALLAGWTIMASFCHHVSHVLCVCSIDDVMRIEARRIVARMQCIIFRPVTVQKKESQSMGKDQSLRPTANVNRDCDCSIASSFCFRERPYPANINVLASEYLLMRPFIEAILFGGSDFSVRPFVSFRNVQWVDAVQVLATVNALRFWVMTVVQFVGKSVREYFLPLDANQGMISVNHAERPENTSAWRWMTNGFNQPLKLSLFGRIFGGHRFLLTGFGVLGLESFTAAQGLTVCKVHI
jgi:hypothetical protein